MSTKPGATAHPRQTAGSLAAQWCLLGGALLAFAALPPHLSLLLFLYFLPALIANKRRHPQRWPIFWLTLLAGWTFAGWVAALVWSVMRLSHQTT